MCEILSFGEVIRDLVPKDFIRCWEYAPPLPSMYQNSRLPERKQVLSINHIVCINKLSTISQSYHLGKFYISIGNCLPDNFPETSQGSVSQAGLFKDSSLRLAVFSFLRIILFFYYRTNKQKTASISRNNCVHK